MAHWQIYILLLYICSSGVPAVMGQVCITSCVGLADGDYQSCIACNVYASCSNENLEDNRPCAEDYLVWNDITKTCEYWSPTCNSTTTTTTSVDNSGTCVTFCTGQTGHFQSCISCFDYVSCSPGHKAEERDCPAGLMWDEPSKQCNWNSSTCEFVANECENNDKVDTSPLSINCTAPSTISVSFAIWGHNANTNFSCIYPWTHLERPCRKNVETIVGTACNGKHECAIEAKNGVFGEDPCKGTYKQLRVGYVCS